VALILDKDTRLIDIDFGGMTSSVTRTAGERLPATSINSGNGLGQLLASVPAGELPPPAPPGTPIRMGGNFIQYQRIDLSMMAENNEVFLPVDVSVQRTSPVPLGGTVNGNNFDVIEEYIYVFSRPLNNTYIIDRVESLTSAISARAVFEDLRNQGLDYVFPDSLLGGEFAGLPTFQQTIFAEKRIYSVNLNNAATVGNGELLDPAPGPLINNSLTGMPSLDSVTTWGSMSAITGPNLHAYRVIISRSQDFSGTPPLSTANEALGGQTSYSWPPVRIAFLCKDPNFTEGEYLTRVANAMNSTPEGGQTNEN
jgi:hypothetical protein